MQENPVPSLPVMVEFSINQVQSDLTVPGGAFVITKPLKYGQYIGYGGVLVYRTVDDKFVAFDLSCPNEAEMDIRVELNGLDAVCPKCKSEFDLIFGSGNPKNGVSQYPLRPYRVYTSDNLNLRIVN